MMGKTHMAFGAAFYSVAVPPSTGSFNELFTWGTGLAVTIVASISADIDDPRNTAGKMIMPIVPRWLRPTAFAVVGALGIWYGYQTGNMLLMMIGFGFFAAAIMRHRNSPTHSPVGMILISLPIYIFLPAYILPVLIGYGSHLIGDAITEGIPYAWPLPGWLCIPLMKTGGFLDMVVVRYGSIGTVMYQLATNLQI